MARNRSASFDGSMSGRRRLSEKPIEDAEGGLLRQRTGVPDGADASWTAVLAVARGNQRSGPLEKLLVHAVQRFAESDAAGKVVVDENLHGKGVRPLFV